MNTVQNVQYVELKEFWLKIFQEDCKKMKNFTKKLKIILIRSKKLAT